MTKMFMHLFRCVVSIVLAFLFFNIHGQSQRIISDSLLHREVVIIKNDGTKYVGTIEAYDEREILVSGNELFGKFYIPLHEIRDIRHVTERSKSGSSTFSTRYFLSTNGLGMDKGERYALLNYYGPEFHAAVANNFSLGLMTSWVAIPLVGAAKYSFSFSENVHMSLGTLVGTLSWIQLSSAGILGYGSFTVGNYVNNFTLSGGYLGITSEGDSFGAPLFSVGCLFRVGEGIQFVGDSFFYIGDEGSFSVIIPGLRFERPSKRSSIQVGIGGAIVDGEAVPIPIPLFSWFFDL